MAFCHECGKPVADKAKFCRNCGASQAEALPDMSAPVQSDVPVQRPVVISRPAPGPEPEPEPEPVTVPVPPPAPAPEKIPEPAGLCCTSCGSPLAPEEKFCGICGTKAGAAAPAPAPAAPRPSIVCPSCGAANETGTTFCGSCGTRIGSAPAAPQAASRFAPAAPAGSVRTCTACGNPIQPGEKYCSKCLVMVKDAVPAAPSPAPATTTAPQAASRFAPAAPAGSVRTCTACGNPIQPGEKYCSKCLVMVKDAVPSAPSPAPAPTTAPQAASPAPAPVPAASYGGPRVCKACGNPIQPGEKFCSKCLVTVNYAEPAMAAPVPVTAPPTESVGSYVCASCGSPLNGNEKFCGICGGPAVAARTTAPAPAGKVCPSCGAPVSDTTKFCGGCGAPVGASFPAGPITAQASGEEILGIIPNARKMKMMGMAYDTFTIVVTGRRMILAQLTQEMLNSAIAEAQAKAKAEGKGFFGVWGDQMAASFGFAKRYETLSPDVALAETPGNVALDNARISAITVSEIRSNDDDGSSNQLRLNIDSADGRFEYVIAEDDRFTTLLKNVYGDRVKLPFGLFKAGPVRIKFF